MDTTSDLPSHRRRRTTGRHLLLLLWKSLLLRKKQWILTLFEVLLPTALFSVVLFLRLLPDSDLTPVYMNETDYGHTANEYFLQALVCFGKYTADGNCTVGSNFRDQTRLFYAPNKPFPASVSNYVAGKLGWMEDDVIAVNNLEEMDDLVQQMYTTTNDSLPLLVGLYFEDWPDDDELPKELNYRLRLPGTWYTDYEYPFFQLPGPGESPERYILRGFALLQSYVDRFFIASVTNNMSYLNDYKLEVKTYPYPPYTDDNGISQLYGSMLPSYMLLGFILLSPSLIKNIVHEKETGVRDDPMANLKKVDCALLPPSAQETASDTLRCHHLGKR